ncbi:MAG: PAS domain S-box protein [Candidatus Wallbacteria bacterium]|nr:PAS domain S-box protein [Candidatus Wallbacteria bacterium]
MTQKTGNRGISPVFDWRLLLPLLIVCVVSASIVSTGIRRLRVSNQRVVMEKNLDRLASDMENMLFGRFTSVTKSLAGNPAVSGHLTGGMPPDSLLQAVLDTTRDNSGASIVYLLDRSGEVTASTFYDDGQSLMGYNYSFRPYFTEAVAGTDSVFPALGVTTGKRGVYFSSPVIDLDKQSLCGVAVLKMEPDDIDRFLIRYGADSVLLTPSGVVFSSSREDWLLKFVPPIVPGQLELIDETRQFNIHDIEIAPLNRVSDNIAINGNDCILVRSHVGGSRWMLLSAREVDYSFPLSNEQRRAVQWSSLLIFVLLAAVALMVMHISIKRRLLFQLAESEEKYRMFFASETDAIILSDPESGAVIDVNGKACSLYGYDREQFLGLQFSDVCAEQELNRNKSPDPAGRSELPFRQHRRKDGSIFPAHLTWGSFHWQGRKIDCNIIRDVTELKGMVKSLQDSEAKFRRLYEGASDAIMLLDESGFIECNQATLNMFACSSNEDFLNRHPSELSPEEQPGGADSRVLSEKHIRKAFREGQSRFEWIHRRCDGTEFPAEVWLTAMEVGDRKILQAVIRDVSGQLKALQSLLDDHHKPVRSS